MTLSGRGKTQSSEAKDNFLDVNMNRLDLIKSRLNGTSSPHTRKCFNQMVLTFQL